jgi:N-acetylglucosaminyl-diphospho-decaprenol L-rhamnosyltransferase
LIAVSIVSHGHGGMVIRLIEQLSAFPEVGQIIVTLNIEESLELPDDEVITVLKNRHPQGFAENHNTAFEYCREDYFCPLNPDVYFQENPFPELLTTMVDERVGMVAPRVDSPSGRHEDSWRHFPTIWALTRKLFGKDSARYSVPVDGKPFSPDWVAGMFMLFEAKSYRKVKGFDEKFFLYYEDVDICNRLWKSNIGILACPKVSIVHDARRDSHRKMKHLYWHLSSMSRYFIKRWTNR